MTKKRNIHRIVIKDFGPIKDVDMEVAGVNVLIGDNGTGKSYISKLIYMFNTISELATSVGTLPKNDFDGYMSLPTDEKIGHWIISLLHLTFDNSTVDKNDFYLEYHYSEDKIIKIKNTGKEFEVVLSDVLKNRINEYYSEYKKVVDKRREKEKNLIPGTDEISEVKELSEIKNEMDENLKGVFGIDPTFFIPTGRSEIALYTGSYLKEKQIYYLSKEFAQLYDSWKSMLSGLYSVSKSQLETQLSKEVRKTIDYLKKEMLNILGGRYEIQDRKEYFYYDEKEQPIELNYISSGQQELIPMLVFFILLNEPKIPIFTIIEEPETHLFPTTQKKLMELMVFAYNQNLGNRVLINTHSPYILTALNNLIQAKNTADAQPDKIAEIEKIIPQGKWLNYNDVRVYEMKDGTLRLLMDEETQLIDADPIDEASTLVNEEYYGLLDLKYEDDDDTDD